MTSVRELVVLYTKPSMLGEFWVHALRIVRRFEQRTFYIGSLRVKLILACQEVALNEPKIGFSSFKFKYYHGACTISEKKLSIVYGEQPMENHRGPTPIRKSYGVGPL